MSVLIEQHYTTQQVAEMLAVCEDTVRAMFRDEPGVIKLTKGTRRGSRGYVAGRVHLRIPQTLLVKKMNELSK